MSKYKSSNLRRRRTAVSVSRRC